MLYSVILPAHRDDDYLAQAVASVEAAMGEDDAELIIVANGPQRDAILARYGKNAPERRTVIVSELPSLANAANRGIEAARGEFIARMDSDDLCLPDRFTNQLAAIRSSGADILFAEAQDIGPDGGPVDLRAPRRQTYPVLPYWPIHPTVLIRRATLVTLGGYGNVGALDDRHLWLRAYEAGVRFDKLDKAVIQRRRHPDQMTAPRDRMERMTSALGMDVAFALRQGRWDVLWINLVERLPRFILLALRKRRAS